MRGGHPAVVRGGEGGRKGLLASLLLWLTAHGFSGAPPRGGGLAQPAVRNVAEYTPDTFVPRLR
jgi:hypothetical protein